MSALLVRCASASSALMIDSRAGWDSVEPNLDDSSEVLLRGQMARHLEPSSLVSHSTSCL